MLPYDGIIRTGSKGISHPVNGCVDEDPRASRQGTVKRLPKQVGADVLVAGYVI